MATLMKRFLACDGGATAIEYGLIAAFLGVGIIVSITGVRDQFGYMTNHVSNGLNGR